MISILTNPEFYDIFGIFVFGFVTLVSGWMLYTNKKPLRIVTIILLIIGISGLLVDSLIVYSNFIK